MFYNIFSQKKKKIERGQKPEIFADIHEKNSLVIANLIERKIEVRIAALKVGDYVVGDTVIERKTVSDFVSSMINRRLIEQLNQMSSYDRRILIVEGDIEEARLENKNSVRGMILSIISSGTGVIFSRDAEETSSYLELLAKQQIKKKQETSLHSRIPKTKEEQRQYVLESFPGIGPRTAAKLLQEFGSLARIFDASQEDLRKILGKKTEEFMGLLDY